MIVSLMVNRPIAVALSLLSGVPRFLAPSVLFPSAADPAVDPWRNCMVATKRKIPRARDVKLEALIAVTNVIERLITDLTLKGTC